MKKVLSVIIVLSILFTAFCSAAIVCAAEISKNIAAASDARGETSGIVGDVVAHSGDGLFVIVSAALLLAAVIVVGCVLLARRKKYTDS
ncbi:MAG: hypothetical protein IJQ80_05710 [Clostridia bacterium]|nr:hypothetical protein [Clostridia bacterium]